MEQKPEGHSLSKVQAMAADADGIAGAVAYAVGVAVGDGVYVGEPVGEDVGRGVTDGDGDGSLQNSKLPLGFHGLHVQLASPA